VKQNADYIYKIKIQMSCFVPENPHRHNAAQRSPEKGTGEQGFFGYAPFPTPRTALVGAVKAKADKIDKQKIKEVIGRHFFE